MAHKATANGNDSTSSTTVATSAGVNTAVGDLLVVMVTGQEGGTINSVTDTAGNTYSSLTAETTFALAQIWYTIATSANASNIVTATFASAVRYKVISIELWDGMASSGTLLAQNTGVDAGVTVVTSGNLVTSDPGVAFFVCIATNDRSWTPGGGATEVYDSTASLGGYSHGSAYLAGISAGTTTMSSTADSASNLGIAAAVFKTSSASPALDDSGISPGVMEPQTNPTVISIW